MWAWLVQFWRQKTQRFTSPIAATRLRLNSALRHARPDRRVHSSTVRFAAHRLTSAGRLKPFVFFTPPVAAGVRLGRPSTEARYDRRITLCHSSDHHHVCGGSGGRPELAVAAGHVSSDAACRHNPQILIVVITSDLNRAGLEATGLVQRLVNILILND
jgi:hypothetical protein